MLELISSIFIFICVFALTKFAAAGMSKRIKTNEVSYQLKPLMTSAEKEFFAELKKLEPYGIHVIPQVNLASVIDKIGNYRWQSELYRNVDFGLFDEEYSLLLLIELNDKSHARPDRQRRDIRVKNICQSANVRLITFWTHEPNDEKYVLHRITEALKSR